MRIKERSLLLLLLFTKVIYCLYLTYLLDRSEHAPFYDHYKAKKSTPTLLSNSQTLIQRPCKETKKR